MRGNACLLHSFRCTRTYVKKGITRILFKILFKGYGFARVNILHNISISFIRVEWDQQAQSHYKDKKLK